MDRPRVPIPGENTVVEGKASFLLRSSGGYKGPARKGGVFFNPAMYQNRDLSILFLQYLLDMDLLVGKKKRVLDGLCGSGARTIRMSMETSAASKGISIIGTDINERSIETAEMNSERNGVSVELLHTDLNKFLTMEHFSYVDIDPFGTPVPFIQSGVRSVLNNGYMGVTATDTAALTGSIPRVARRRYGVDVMMTHAYQEMACRTLMGHIARTAAAFERGVEPVLFYSSDHFVRGYVKLSKGAKKADASLGNVGWIKVSMPSPPDEVFTSFDGVDMTDGAIMGPIWTGDLEDPQILNGILEMLEDEERWGYLPSYFATRKMVERALSESGLPILGYDVNELSSSLKVSPPSMGTIFENLGHLGRRVSRSRFSPTIFKTDAELDEIRPIFISEGG